MATKTSQPYVPLLEGSLLWRLAFSVVYPVVLIVGIDLPPDASRGSAAASSTRAFLAASWGPKPDPDVRFGRRKLAGACGIVDAAASGILAVLLVGAAHATSLRWLTWVAAIPALVAGFAAAAGIIFGTRGSMTVIDATEWEHAGRPRDWSYRRVTQPRTIDVLAIGLLGALFSVVLLGSVLGH